MTQSIRIRVSQLFKRLKAQMDDVETEVMNSIKESTMLQEFLDSAEQLQDEVDGSLIDYIHDEN